jgi:hypothetical protein
MNYNTGSLSVSLKIQHIKVQNTAESLRQRREINLLGSWVCLGFQFFQRGECQREGVHCFVYITIFVSNGRASNNTAQYLTYVKRQKSY